MLLMIALDSVFSTDPRCRELCTYARVSDKEGCYLFVLGERNFIEETYTQNATIVKVFKR